jgi:hypothetical protein
VSDRKSDHDRLVDMAADLVTAVERIAAATSPLEVQGLTDRIAGYTRSAADEITRTAVARRAPHVLQRAKVAKFEGRWVCWTGRYAVQDGEFAHAIDGVYATGLSPAEACRHFDEVWIREDR